MKDIFKHGDQKVYTYQVTEEDVAAFNDTTVHPVCATFALAREIEWSTRLFVLEMKDEDEEGIGTKLEIDHLAPAFVGEQLQIRAVVQSLIKNELICSYEAAVGDRLVARGMTGQKILKKHRLEEIFSAAKPKDA